MAPLPHFRFSGSSFSWRALDRVGYAIAFLIPVWLLLPPATLAGSPTSWQEDASLRADGLLFRLRRRLEQNETNQSVKDERGERYVLEIPGIVYSPADDNWSPAIPSTEEAPLFLARARGLLRSGAMEAAMEILPGLQTMDGRFYRTSEAARRSSAGASDLLHRLSVQRTDTADIRFRLDPFFVYDAAAGETWLISDPGGFRAAIPGRWRMRRLPGFGSTPEHLNRIVELTDGTYRITFVMDVWSGATRPSRHAEFLELMDMRRGLDRGRKESTGFSRTCSDGICACTFTEKGARRSWDEFVKTRRGAAFFFSVSPSNDRLLRAVRIAEGSARDTRSNTEDS